MIKHNAVCKQFKLYRRYILPWFRKAHVTEPTFLPKEAKEIKIH